jgi:CRP-like cAMP-binding protein
MASNKAASKTASTPNQLLASLPPADFNRIVTASERIELPRRTRLEQPQKRIEKVHFLESGVVSIVASGGVGTEVEVGIIGREGMSGLALIHSADRSPYSSYMQVAGAALRVDAEVVRLAMKRSAQCNQVFLNFAQTFTLQIAETAVANARATLVERLSRWLLMVQDRVGSGAIPLTHEFLSLMIGARRPGVTEAIHVLAEKSLVSTTRGKLTIVDRAGLEAYAGRFYGVPEREYRRLLGS